MAQLRAPVQAPTARPPAYGLIAAAPVVEDATLRWVGGWEFQPEGCGVGGRDSIACEGNVGVMEHTDRPGIIDGDPIWIWSGDNCSTFGSAERDWMGRARRQLAAIESYELANELWEGTITIADTLVNRYLAGPVSDILTGAAATPVAALGCIEGGLAEYLHGAQGMVHVTPQLLTHLVSAQVVTRVGNLWVTPTGHIVVADAGYTGSGPDSSGPTSSSQWIYGTPIIQVRLGPVQTIPGDLASARELAAAMNRGINDVTVLAGRVAGFQWSNECAHVAAEVNVGVCAIGGS